MRQLLAVLCLTAALAGCQQAPPDYVSTYTAPNSPPLSNRTSSLLPAAPVAIIGDSFTGGTQLGGQGPDSWPTVVAARLRQQGIDIAASVVTEEGSGYVSPGAYQGAVFADQIPKVVRSNDRLVVFFGSSSDVDVPPAELESAVRRTLDAAREAAPTARLVVIGPALTQPNPPPDVLRMRDVIRTQADDVRATFVDPIDLEWFADRPDLVAPDGIHPSNTGHTYMADEIAPILAQQLGQPTP